jgi:hypothetical protein
MKHLLSISLLVSTPLWLAHGPAYADSQTCDAVAADVVTVDGLLDDWRAAGAREVGAKDQDASFSVRCAYDEAHLHLGIAVRDDYLYRGKKPTQKTDDHLIIELGVGSKRDRLLLYPGNDKQDPVRQWNGKAVPKWLEVEDTQARRGVTLEVSIPLARVRGYAKGTPSIDVALEYRDADFAAKVESKLAYTGRLEFQAASELYDGFMKAAKLTARDIKLDQMANIDDRAGAERVIAGRDVIGVLSDSFFFMTLPVASPSDVKSVQLADLRGDGTRSVVVEIRQHGNGGSRDLVIVYELAGTAFRALSTFETRKAKGGQSLVNRWSLVPKGKFRALERDEKKYAKRGHDLVIEVSESDVTGWDEDNYLEAPAADATPILLPWSDETSRVYYFVGNTVQGGEAKARKRK